MGSSTSSNSRLLQVLKWLQAILLTAIFGGVVLCLKNVKELNHEVALRARMFETQQDIVEINSMQLTFLRQMLLREEQSRKQLERRIVALEGGDLAAFDEKARKEEEERENRRKKHKEEFDAVMQPIEDALRRLENR